MMNDDGGIVVVVMMIMMMGFATWFKFVLFFEALFLFFFGRQETLPSFSATATNHPPPLNEIKAGVKQ